jgi:hypothetical protein
MMTRKDYVKTAEILKSYHGYIDDGLFNDLVDDFGDWFSEDNPNFNAGRFLEAIYETKED